MNYYAHSLEGHPKEQWQPLDEHLRNVAELAAEFAKPFGGEDWAWIAGLWHDLGKYSDAFQNMLDEANGIESHLETKSGKVVHSEAGGHLAQSRGWKGIDRVLCWLIMGHHAGLADYASADAGAKALEPKMRTPEGSAALLKSVPDEIKNQPQPGPPKPLLKHADISFFIRMLFSCVVDADFLDTEAFMDRRRSRLRQAEYPDLHELLSKFDKHMEMLCSNAESTEVNRIRAVVLEQCRAAAESDPAAFSLTVPTGGGKTLASMAFALRHAVKHGKRRIIYVIPYTSIIEQTAEVFRRIPGFESAVLEHHCNVVDEDETRESVRSRLATENWDAPVIVTTSVQFFESLYAAKTSRCRKLHNIADSVVIYDEAQCLPPDFLRPVVFAIRELQLFYGVTPVLCTATQPVLTQTDSFDFRFREGFSSVTEIMKDPGALSVRLKRVEVDVLHGLDPVGIDTVADHLLRETQSVLCVLNRKDDSRELAQRLPEAQTLCLTTNLCAEHRSKVFAVIRQRLNDDPLPLYVISTSLVEAGVDLDFPVVYRALAGLDSIAQAAGRCNREGKLSVGKTIVFLPQEQPRYVHASASLAREYLRPDRISDVFLPQTFQSYFGQRFFQLGSDALDKERILELLGGNLAFSFRTAAERFRMIDDDWQRQVIVPYGEAQALVDRLLIEKGNERINLRRLQRFTVSIPIREYQMLVDADHAHLLKDWPGVCVLHNKNLYSERYGYLPPGKIDSYAPEMLIG
jgi:CRISPR-associated endonuclease/helicase Cas3